MSRDEAHGAEMEEDSVEAEEATFQLPFGNRWIVRTLHHRVKQGAKERTQTYNHTFLTTWKINTAFPSKCSLTPTKYSQDEESFSALQVLFAGGGYDLL